MRCAILRPRQRNGKYSVESTSFSRLRLAQVSLGDHHGPEKLGLSQHVYPPQIRWDSIQMRRGVTCRGLHYATRKNPRTDCHARGDFFRDRMVTERTDELVSYKPPLSLHTWA